MLFAAVEAEPEVALAGEVHVEAEVGPTEDVQVAVRLGLHRVGAEVGDDAEAPGRIGLAELNGELRSTGEERRLPELLLAHVNDRRHEVHERRPIECIVEGDEFVVLVADAAWERAGCDAAERALARAARRGATRHRGGAPAGRAPSGGSPAQ